MKASRVIALLAGVLFAIPLIVSAGCTKAAPTPPAESSAAQPFEMPDYNMAEVEDAGTDLTKMGLKVVVIRPGFTVTCDEKTTKPGFTFNIAELRQDFKEDAWDHWVTLQDPAAGAQVTAGSTVILTAGEHLGAGPGKTWLAAHGEEVKRNSDAECVKSCHKPEHCTECHDQAGVKDDKAPKSK